MNGIGIDDYLNEALSQVEIREGEPKYTHEQFMDAINELSQTSNPSSECFDCHREVIAYFKKHPGELVKPGGYFDNVEQVLITIYPVDGK